MEKVTITKVYISNKSKDGKEFKDKNGKPFWKIAIKTDKTGNDYYSCLAFRKEDAVMNLKEGDEKILVLREEGGFKNFRLPSKLDVFEAQLNELHQRISALENPKGNEVGNTGMEYPEENINPEEIPF